MRLVLPTIELVLYGFFITLAFVVSKSILHTEEFGEKITSQDDILKVKQVRNVFVISLIVFFLIELLNTFLKIFTMNKSYMGGIIISFTLSFWRFCQFYKEDPKCVACIKMADFYFLGVFLVLFGKIIDIFK